MTRTSNPMPLAATTFGYLYRESFADALGRIAATDYRQIEIAAGPPHVDLSAGWSDSVRSAAASVAASGLQCVSINPLELNPISLNAGLAEACARQYEAAVLLAAELGATHVVMISGRASPLVPVARETAVRLLGQQLHRLLPEASRRGVRLTVEAVPYGFLQTVDQVSEALDELQLDEVGVTLDAANLFFVGADPAEQARAHARRTEVVHISDTWRDRWAHTGVGQGEVDFGALATALRETAFHGPSVYELADAEDPSPRFAGDWPQLSGWGWGPDPAA